MSWYDKHAPVEHGMTHKLPFKCHGNVMQLCSGIRCKPTLSFTGSMFLWMLILGNIVCVVYLDCVSKPLNVESILHFINSFPKIGFVR
jgi:hypothetical protein